MITFFNYIKNIFSQYTGLYDFYLKELSNYISLFEFYNSFILLVIFYIIIIRFLIIRYTLKKLLIFIIKRIIFYFLFFFLFSFFLSPMYCENSVTKLFDTNTKKICIATFVVTGCYLSYKYIPIYYKTIMSHKNYTDYLKKKELYSSQTIEYSVYLEKLNKQNNLIIEYNENFSLFNNLIKQYCTYFQNFVENGDFNLIFNDLRIVEFNSYLSKVKLKLISEGIKIDTDDLDSKLIHIFNNFIKNGTLVKELNDSGIEYKINKSLYNYQNNCFIDLDNLIYFYKQKLIPIFLNNSITDLDLNICIKLVKELNILLNKTKLSSDLMYSNFLKIQKSEILVKPLDVTLNVCDYKKPIEPEPVDFLLENLEGFRYIGINFGYVVFYPILYSSNKILGTCNPLSSKAFTEAIAYLISLIKFF